MQTERKEKTLLKQNEIIISCEERILYITTQYSSENKKSAMKLYSGLIETSRQKIAIAKGRVCHREEKDSPSEIYTSKTKEKKW